VGVINMTILVYVYFYITFHIFYIFILCGGERNGQLQAD
jgi:hypothetical protein